MKTFSCFLLSALALMLPHSSHAAGEATDNASNYAGLTSYVGSNRGIGYASAFRDVGSTSGSFLGSSGQIDTAGLAFGLQSLDGGSYSVSRDFSGGLGTRQFFRVELQPVSVGAGGSFSLGLRNVLQTTGTDAFISYASANPNYTFTLSEFNPNTGFTTRRFDTGVPFSTNPLTIIFTAASPGVTVSLTPFGGSTTTLSGTVVGSFGSLSVNTLNSTLYFNNPSLVPEPGPSVIVLAASSIVLWLFLARRRQAA